MLDELIALRGRMVQKSSDPLGIPHRGRAGVAGAQATVDIEGPEKLARTA
ncbi:hypothetical protein ACFUNF_23080 [Streptomyces sp. NPDC057291]